MVDMIVFACAVASKNFGGGVYAISSSRALFFSCTLIGNSADDSGGALYLDTGDSVVGYIDHSLVTNNQAIGLGCGTWHFM